MSCGLGGGQMTIWAMSNLIWIRIFIAQASQTWSLLWEMNPSLDFFKLFLTHCPKKVEMFILWMSFVGICIDLCAFDCHCEWKSPTLGMADVGSGSNRFLKQALSHPSHIVSQGSLWGHYSMFSHTIGINPSTLHQIVLSLKNLEPEEPCRKLYVRDNSCKSIACFCSVHWKLRHRVQRVLVHPCDK